MKKISIKNLLLSGLGIALARATILGFNPIGVAYFAAMYLEKKTRYLVFPMVIIGMSTCMPMVDVIKYGIIMLLIALLTSIIEGKEGKIPSAAVGIISGVLTSILAITKAALDVSAQYFIIMAILEGIIVFTITIVFSKGIKYVLYEKNTKQIGNEELISLAIIVAVATYGIPKDLIYNFSIVETAIYFAILYFGYKFGSGAGAIAGALCGIVLGLESNSINIIGVMCIIGILAGMFRETGRIFTAIGYCTGVMVLGYFYESTLMELSVIRALVSGVLLFLLLPRSIIIRTESTEAMEDDDTYIKERLKEHRQSKLKEFSESFSRLSGTFNTMTEKKSNFSRQEVNDIFDDLTERICKDCSNCDICWRNEFYDTYKAAFSMFSSAEKNGVIQEKDIPKNFASKCINYNKFLTETNRIFEIAKINLTWHNRMAESREAVAGQLYEVASIINEFSLDLYETKNLEETKENQIINFLRGHKVCTKKIAILEKRNKKHEIYIIAKTERGRCVTTKEVASYISEVTGKRMKPSDATKNIIPKEYETCVFVEDTNFKVLSGAARAIKHKETVSGDNFSFLQLNGQTAMILSDGMGSGLLACRESESVVELLEQLMEAGFKEESAIKLINSVLVLKTDQQTFSTIDMSVIDQYTGVCEFIKIGASTTFIKRDNWVETIRSTTLPIGVFNQVDYDTVVKKLYDGDFVIMVSDGIIDSIIDYDKEAIIEKIIMESESQNPQELATEILNKALQYSNNKAIDDMTVLVSGIWKK